MTGGDERARRVREVEQRLDLPRADEMNNKVFKRSSYHVAIAYHIYIKKMSQRGPLMNEVDPTLRARRLKDGLPRENWHWLIYDGIILDDIVYQALRSSLFTSICYSLRFIAVRSYVFTIDSFLFALLAIVMNFTAA